jgi:hypothetical protein
MLIRTLSDHEQVSEAESYLIGVKPTRGQKPIRPIKILGSDAFITLTQGYVSVIDAADVSLVEGRNWSADVHRRNGEIWNVYAVALVEGKLTRLHRVITAAAHSTEVDHRDGDGLNNRRESNLRVTIHAMNQCNQRVGRANKSGFKGVSWASRDKRWRAQIQFNGQNIGLGHFKDKEAAHAAYVEASKKYHGEFGRTA